MCSECGWAMEDAAEHLRKITALALANPHIVKAVADFLRVDAVVPLNPAGDGGGFICISPPGSPRAWGTQAFEDTARKAFDRLTVEAEQSQQHEEDPAEEALFDQG